MFIRIFVVLTFASIFLSFGAVNSTSFLSTAQTNVFEDSPQRATLFRKDKDSAASDRKDNVKLNGDLELDVNEKQKDGNNLINYGDGLSSITNLPNGNDVISKYNVMPTEDDVPFIDSEPLESITSKGDFDSDDDTTPNDVGDVSTKVDDYHYPTQLLLDEASLEDDDIHNDEDILDVDDITDRDDIALTNNDVSSIDSIPLDGAASERDLVLCDDNASTNEYAATTPVDDESTDDVEHQDNSLHIDDEADDSQPDSNKSLTDDAMSEHDDDLTEDTISGADEIPAGENTHADVNLYIHDDIHNDEDTLDVDDITDKDDIPLTNNNVSSINSISFDDITSERDSRLSDDTASTDEYAVTTPVDDESTDDAEHQDNSSLVVDTVDEIRPEIDGTQIEDAALEDETDSLDDVTLNDDDYDVTTPVDNHFVNDIIYQDNSLLHIDGDDNQRDNNKFSTDDAMSEDDADLTEDTISEVDEIPFDKNVQKDVNLFILDVPLDNSIPTENVTCKVVDINSDDIEGTNEIDEVETERTIEPNEAIACHTDSLLLINNASDEDDDINNDVDTLDVEVITDKDDMSSIDSVPFDDITSERDSILSGDTASTDVYDVTRPVDDESTDDVQHHVNLLHIDDEGDDNQPEDNKLPTDDAMFEDDVDLTEDIISGVDEIPAGENTHENVNFFIHDVQQENSIPTENVTCKVVDINSDDNERTDEIDEVETGGNIEPNETITRHTDSLLLIGNGSDEDDIHNDEDTLDVNDITDKDDIPLTNYDMPSIDSISFDDITFERDSELCGDTASTDEYAVTTPVDDESTDDAEHQDNSSLVVDKVDEIRPEIDGTQIEDAALEDETDSLDDVTLNDDGYDVTTPVDNHFVNAITYQDNSLHVEDEGDDNQLDNNKLPADDAMSEDDADLTEDVISGMDEIPVGENIHENVNLLIHDVPLDNSIPTGNVTCKVVDINSDDIEGTNEIDEIETERTIKPSETIACHTDSLLLIDNASDENDDINNDVDTLDVEDITDKDDMSSIVSVPFDDITSERDSILSGDTASTDVYDVTRPVDDESTDDVQHHVNSLHIDDEGDDNQPEDNKLPTDDAMFEDDVDLTKDIISGMDEIPAGENTHENVNFFIHDVQQENSIPTENVTCKVVDINSDDNERTNEIDEVETGGNIEPNETITRHTDSLLLIGNGSDEDDEIHNDEDTLDVDDNTDKDDNPLADDDMSSIESITLDDVASDRDSILSDDIASNDDDYDVTRPVDDESTDDVEHQDKSLLVAEKVDDVTDKDDIALTNNDVSSIDSIPLDGVASERDLILCDDNASTDEYAATTPVDDESTDDVEHQDKSLLVAEKVDDIRPEVDGIQIENAALEDETNSLDDVTLNYNDYDVTTPVDDHSINDITYQDNSLHVEDVGDDNQPDTNIFSTDDVMSAYDTGLIEDSKIDISVLKNLTLAATSAIYSITKTYPTQTAKRTKPADDIIIDDELSSEAGDPYIDDCLSKYYAMPTNGIKTESVSLLPDYIMSQVNPLTTDDNIPETEISFIDEVSSENAVVPSDFIPTNDVTTADYVLPAEYTISEADDVISDQFSFKDGEIIKQLNKDEGLRMSVNDAVGKDDNTEEDALQKHQLLTSQFKEEEKGENMDESTSDHEDLIDVENGNNSIEISSISEENEPEINNVNLLTPPNNIKQESLENIDGCQEDDDTCEVALAPFGDNAYTEDKENSVSLYKNYVPSLTTLKYFFEIES